MRNATHVPELDDDTAALFMDGIGHPGPALDLFGRVNARRPGIALPLLGNLRAFGDDKGGRSTLARGHHDPAGQIERADADGGKELVGHGKALRMGGAVDGAPADAGDVHLF
ncbi:hypothetical protein E4T56_gene8045 [Termitomyces sp. T112]|nr:hypothetical protein E4T56_gene8045 [Termitomyces sp. T112]